MNRPLLQAITFFFMILFVRNLHKYEEPFNTTTLNLYPFIYSKSIKA